jgi:DNA invertase Pin-like site-specific DNA recombinase
LSPFEHDPVTDEAAYAELRRFFTDVSKHMQETGTSPFHIALATRVSRSTLENYLREVDKGQRFRISEDTAARLAGWARLDLSGYQFARVPRGGMRRQPAAAH